MKSFHFWFMRLDSVGSPFRSVQAGVPENDRLNNVRYNEGLRKFLITYRGIIT